ncbi:MAG: hypothetical protein SFY32_02545 [Bacteroidota bacterium]|nr:hypothetical protein [Bacteroidota bacterium]
MNNFIHQSILFLSIFSVSISTYAQGVFAPINPDYYHLVDRYEILSGKFAPKIFTTYKAILRKDIAGFADSLKADSNNFSKVDKFNISYLANDNWEFFPDSLHIGNSKRKPILKYLYQKQNAAISFRNNEFEFQINPVINFEQTTDNKSYPLSLNTRGVEIRGMIGKRLGFYTMLSDNQAFVHQYVANQMNMDPNATNVAFQGEGFTKSFVPTSKYFKNPNQNGYDFFSARGYIYFNVIKQISIQFGHDKNFIGNGYRSMFLSDNSSKYLFLRAITKVWKLNYTNLFTEMTATNISGNKYNPRKYLAMHHLGINITKNLNVGLFEAIMFQRNDSLTGNNGFELNYLNPVIFYREVESYLGSLDKTTVGLDLKWNFLKHFSFYGQFGLHEFKLEKLMAQKGWWGNKYVWQVGLKYINVFGVKNLDLQLENNFARPFAYADKNSYTGFTNYGQPLAHPLGANFYEMIGIIRYQPINRLSINPKIFYMVYGTDYDSTNYGGNLFKSYISRTMEEGNIVGQGNKNTVIFASINVSYMLFHNFFIEIRHTYRQHKSASIQIADNFTTFGIRWNIAARLHEF